MEAFYSIIYYKPNALTDELLALGILASGGEGPFIHISRRRMDLLKKILHSSQFTSIKRHLGSLKKSVNDDRSAPNELLLFDPTYSKERLESLSERTKGALEYSPPVTINEWLNHGFFEELTAHFLGDRIDTKKTQRPVFQLRWKAFYRSNRFNNWRKDVPIEEFADSVIPFHADLLSQENKVIVKGLDFDLQPATVKKRIEVLRLAEASCKDYKMLVIHPSVRKKSGKAFLESMNNTVQHIELKKFTEFKKNL